MSLTAGAPLPVLMNSLERAGWGDLAGHDLRGVRVVLGALSRLIPPGSASGHVTIEQIAGASGYSMRWTQSRLYWLEEAEVIVWHRGGVVEGRPAPSVIRIDKRRVLALVQIARDIRDEALARFRELTRARIAGLRRLDVRSRVHKRRSVHVELTPSLPPTGEVTPSPPPPYQPSADTAGYLAAARAAVREARRTR